MYLHASAGWMLDENIVHQLIHSILHKQPNSSIHPSSILI
jgi:hypothetical protein